MRSDQLSEDNAESERTRNYRDPKYMDYTPLVILQQRLNALETNYGAQNPNDGSIPSPRVARVAPMQAGSDNALGRLPSISYRATATFDISALQLPNPTEATFSSAAAAVAAAAPIAAPIAAMGSAVHVASNSASYSTAPSNTTTYASSPIRYSTGQPSLYCIASTSRNGYHGSRSAYNSDTDSATSTETISANEHDYDEIPPFRRRALALDINNDGAAAIVATALSRRRALEENEEEDTVPVKKAKRMLYQGNGNGSGDGGNGSGVGGNVDGNDGNKMMDY